MEHGNGTTKYGKWKQEMEWHLSATVDSTLGVQTRQITKGLVRFMRASYNVKIMTSKVIQNLGRSDQSSDTKSFKEQISEFK